MSELLKEVLVNKAARSESGKRSAAGSTAMSHAAPWGWNTDSEPGESEGEAE